MGMMNSSPDLGDQIDNIVVETQAKESQTALLTLGILTQRIAANAVTASDETLISLFLSVATAKNTYNSWMDW
jgi:hypothetical protein